MSYTPTTWAAGDTVTAAKLNKLEQGVASGGGVLMVNATKSDDAVVCDKTAGEMLSAYKSGTTVIIKAASEGMITYQNVAWVEECDNDETMFYTATDIYEALTLDDYPSHSLAD